MGPVKGLIVKAYSRKRLDRMELILEGKNMVATKWSLYPEGFPYLLLRVGPGADPGVQAVACR